MAQAINTASTRSGDPCESTTDIKIGDLEEMKKLTAREQTVADELAAMGITNYNPKKNTACFFGVDMAVDTAKVLAQDPDNAKKNERDTADATRDETDKRLAKPLASLSSALTKLLANGSGLIPSDLSRISYEIGTDGTVDATFRHTGKPRTGEPNIKYGGFTGGELKSHNVVSFVKLAHAKNGKDWLKDPVDTAKSGAAMCEVDHKPYAGQKDADDNHSWAGCDRATCGANCHGDNADRGATYGKRSEYGARGWHIERADGSRENLADINWDTTA